jgi:hypothetical protein
VLVVEDEVLATLELSSELADAGFDVLGPAGSVGEALYADRKLKFPYQTFPYR